MLKSSKEELLIKCLITILLDIVLKHREGEQFGKNGRRRRIAAKIIDKRKAPPDFVSKFLPRELDVYIQLDHPNIIKVYDIFEIQHRIYIFMELAEGGDLLDLIKVRIYI